MEQFTDAEIKELSRFRFSLSQTNSKISIQIGQFLLDDNVKDYLADIKTRVDAANDRVAASIFSKRYAFLAVITLYAMSVFNKGIMISDLNKIWLETDDEAKNWLPTIRITELDIVPFMKERTNWRNLILENLFKNNFQLMWDHLHKHTKISKSILWENTAVYIFWLYEQLIENLSHLEIVETIKQDFMYVIKESPGSLFGSYHHNPLTCYYSPKTYVPELKRNIRYRKTCCLSYLSMKGTRCITCPYNCNASKRKEELLNESKNI